MSTALVAAEAFLAEGAAKSETAKKSNHQAKIIRISEVLPHPDPETTNLEFIRIGGYQVVVRKGEFKSGDLGVYIQPDSVVPQTIPFKFIWGPYSVESHEQNYGTVYSDVPEKRRRITVRKFRGEWSEGLLLPLADFPELSSYEGVPNYGPGEDVSSTLGITHYNPDVAVESTKSDQTAGPHHKYPKTFKGWFYWTLYKLGFRYACSVKSYTQSVKFELPVYDVEAFKNYANVFQEGEPVIITEKIHGSNARFVCIDGIMYAGSRTQWKAPRGTDVWHKALEQNPWIEEWCRMYPGYALYGEVTPTQKGFDYGSKGVQFFVFDIRTPDGKWLPQDKGAWAAVDNDHRVPVFYSGPFKADLVKKYVDGPSSVIGATHIREGIVIKSLNEDDRVRGLGRKQLKIVSNTFLHKDSQ